MERQNFETKWNWGAFANAFNFGIGNRAYLCLLVLIPVFNFIWIFVCGFKGEKWVLNNPSNNYRDEEEFRKSMDTWKRAGFVNFIIGLVVIVIYILLFTLGIAQVIANGD